MEVKYEVVFVEVAYDRDGKVYINHPLGSYDNLKDAVERMGEPLHRFHIDVEAEIDGKIYVFSIPGTFCIDWELYGLINEAYILAYMAMRNIISTHCVLCGQVVKVKVLCNECYKNGRERSWDEIVIWNDKIKERRNTQYTVKVVSGN